MSILKEIHVAVGVVKRNDTFFICKRSKEQHQGGLWEFPGGKVEPGESVFEALSRELSEEIGIQVHSSTPFMVIQHRYSDKNVRLDVHLVEDFEGEPLGAEGQECTWVSNEKLDEYDFPKANEEILKKLLKC
ncbi:8-oxo-dGTP diphosphatase MutT [Glaciecola sp. KUL10]|uniref:8-oxo-dGTP diphosphatase MutT n=1 Tax=Glaciecola sp. (strain KUL10) TaxID=2161813 RepID=UPI000D789905|nr:8-oxo-dGTP diphosphatase MutT [Glaciecola sp. KUL10]GBL05631.1 7,8-dihydro-8-oxoguanine-triphosphatase [Glaciecola sp. KUL10]